MKKNRLFVLAGAAVLAVMIIALAGCDTATGDDGPGITLPVMKRIPAGSFQRDGTAANVSVISTAFYLAETETTQELFEAVMGVNPSSFNGESGKEPATGEVQKKRPVENVNWYHAIAFCNKLSRLAGKSAAYSVKVGGNEINWAGLTYDDIPTEDNADWNTVTIVAGSDGYRLPTEMQWMWAAMGADTAAPGQPNTTGYAKAFAGSAGSNNIDDYAWYGNNGSPGGNSGSKTHEVGKKTANELGLKDMSGNVWEWCWDWWADNYPTGTQPDYTGAASGSSRVIRGASWIYGASDCTVAFRGYPASGPSNRSGDLGFRVACP